MILLIDNYDSFTYNLYQLLSALGTDVEVRRNDEVSMREVAEMSPSGIVISPGPGYPADAGMSCDLVRLADVPLLGVCLGHQAVGAAFGGQILPAPELRHGKTSLVYHRGTGLYSGLPSPFQAVRYHSLAIERDTLPACLEVTAETVDGTIMGVSHRERSLEGIQFHPESILTTEGPHMLANFLARCKAASPTGPAN